MIIGLPVKFGRKMMKTMKNNKKPKNIIPVTLSIVDNGISINGDESITLSLEKLTFSRKYGSGGTPVHHLNGRKI